MRIKDLETKAPLGDLPAMANQIRTIELRQINPTGKSLLIFRNGVKTLLQKYFCFRLTQISSLIRPVLSRKRGVAHVTNVGRDAVDAGGAFDERRRSVRRSRVVLTPRCWRQVCEKKRR
jgi:hypothetical protein